MDEGLPIAYQVLDEGVPVLASDGEQVGTVHHVLAAPEKDIFHGLVITTPGHGLRFVEAADDRLAARTRRRPADRLGRRAEPARSRSAARRCSTRIPASRTGWRHWVHKLHRAQRLATRELSARARRCAGRRRSAAVAGTIER